MRRLVVLNGPPGIGKSTIARRYVDDHPLTLALEQDVVRSLIGGWQTHDTESQIVARELCLAMAGAQLREGREVIVPQFVAVPSYLDRLREVATETGSAYVELLLVDTADASERRFLARSQDPSLVEHQLVAAAAVARAGGYRHEYDRLLSGAEGRALHLVESAEGDVELTYSRVLAAVDACAQPASP